MSYKRSLQAAMVVLVFVVVAALPLRAADANMTANERAHVLKLLEDSQNEYLSYIENVNDAQWNWKPAANRWSVGQTAEHILLAENALFKSVQQAVKAPANPDWEKATAGTTEFLERVMVDRSLKATAPESLNPAGLSKDEVIRRFKALRAQVIQFTRETKVPMKEYTLEHPFPVFGTLNAYQWLLYIPLHNLRHDKQIAEVKNTPGYPH